LIFRVCMNFPSLCLRVSSALERVLRSTDSFSTLGIEYLL
jgi:hypothetical protein